MRIELTTSSLPRKCSTTELQRLIELWGLKSQNPNLESPSPGLRWLRAEDEVRTRDLQLGRLSLYQLSYFRIIKLKELNTNVPAYATARRAVWAGEESNLWSRKTADLQSAPFGHSGTCPFKNKCKSKHATWNLLSHLSESNQRPTDYKSVALPTELKWLIIFNYQLAG